MLVCALASTGVMAMEMTGSGTWMEVIDSQLSPPQKESPE